MGVSNLPTCRGINEVQIAIDQHGKRLFRMSPGVITQKIKIIHIPALYPSNVGPPEDSDKILLLSGIPGRPEILLTSTTSAPHDKTLGKMHTASAPPPFLL